MEQFTESRPYDRMLFGETVGKICKEYGFLRCDPIGKSCGGREIPLLRLGRAREYVLFAAAFHGSEYITENILLFFVEELCRALRNGTSVEGLDVTRALHGRGLLFVPCVNPDGCEIAIRGAAGCAADRERIERLCRGDFAHWNANLRGVDINHNFPAGWEELHKREQEAGIIGPAPRRFGGYRPESEPETIALTTLCRTRTIRHVIALHTQGEVIYGDYGGHRPRRSERMEQILATASGYTPEHPEPIASGGGFKDWFIETFNRPGFTFEIGRGENPLPIETAERLYLDVRKALLLAAVM